jgi:hypothetical protein
MIHTANHLGVGISIAGALHKKSPLNKNYKRLLSIYATL